jgi:hypothetical protein
MSSESVCQVARSWVDVGSFHMYLVVRFMNFTESVRNMLDTPSYFPPLSIDIKNERSYTSAPPTCLHVLLANLQENQAVFRIFITLLRFSFESSSYL